MRLLLFFLTGVFLILNLQWKQVSFWEVMIDALSLGEPTATAANRTTEAAVLVYNRVPKCSSTSMNLMLEALAATNSFTVQYGANPAHDIRIELRVPGMEETLMSKILAMPKSSVYVIHIHNPDWRKYGVKVNLINMVRDPIARMVSWFYYVR